MTKEQYLVFKSDLKLAIEGLMPHRLFKTVHHGYASDEEYKTAWNDALKKTLDNDSKIKVRRKGYGDITYSVISATSCATHWAYYCAKHQLNDEQAYEYVKAEYNKMREPRTMDATYFWHAVKDILKSYEEYEEEVVCTD